MALRKQTRLASESALFLLVIGASLVLLNLLGAFGVNLRGDVTQARVFSLSTGSKRLAKSLDDQLEIRAYFSKELPPPYNSMGRYVRDSSDAERTEGVTIRSACESGRTP